MDTAQIIEERSTVLVPYELQKQLITLQSIQYMLLGLIYDQRKYFRHCPDLGYMIWYGRALRALENTEEQIDQTQQAIKTYIQIQDN